MRRLNTGDTAPDFTLPTDGGGEITLSKLRGKKIVVYFYPKDDTPGCTTESCDFRDLRQDFKNLSAEIIGISKDSVKKHDKFKEKYNLNFPLASDENSDTCERFGVWVEKSMYGRKYMGIERSTFLIDEQGKIIKAWYGVKVPGHAENIRTEIEAQKKAA